MRSIFDDMFNLLNIACDPKVMDTFRVQNTGLRGIISKPHNLYTVKDENGTVSEWIMEMVYTPFKKEDIHVAATNNTLSVEIGTENKEDDDTLVYRGISNQHTKFELSLSDKIDTENISAKADDGILKITMPVKKAVPIETRQIPLQ